MAFGHYSAEGLFLAFIVLLGAGNMLYRRWMNKRTLDWPTADAVVREHIIRPQRMDINSIQLVYSYAVEGRQYQGSVPSSKSVLDALPVGARLVVHYKPHHPQTSYVQNHDLERAVWMAEGKEPPF